MKRTCLRIPSPLELQLWHPGQPVGQAADVRAKDDDRHGAGHGHVQAHEPPRRPQDHGGDQEGGRQRGPPTGQLQRQDPGRENN